MSRRSPRKPTPTTPRAALTSRFIEADVTGRGDFACKFDPLILIMSAMCLILSSTIAGWAFVRPGKGYSIVKREELFTGNWELILISPRGKCIATITDGEEEIFYQLRRGKRVKAEVIFWFAIENGFHGGFNWVAMV